MSAVERKLVTLSVGTLCWQQSLVWCRDWVMLTYATFYWDRKHFSHEDICCYLLESCLKMKISDWALGKSQQSSQSGKVQDRNMSIFVWDKVCQASQSTHNTSFSVQPVALHCSDAANVNLQWVIMHSLPKHICVVMLCPRLLAQRIWSKSLTS